MNSPQTMTLQPKISEKSYALGADANTYTFEVPLSANKLEIKRAVERQFKVTVTDVNVTRIKGKRKRSLRKRGAIMYGQRKSVKKAYVTLKKGDKIPLFEETS